jgi:hypothetical protein
MPAAENLIYILYRFSAAGIGGVMAIIIRIYYTLTGYSTDPNTTAK